MGPDGEEDQSGGRDAVTGVLELAPDIVLMDLVMPVMDGIKAIQRIRSEGSQTRILVLTSFATDDKVFPAIKAGALGYLIKDTAPEELLRAVRQVYRANRPCIRPSPRSCWRKYLARPSGRRTWIP